MHIDEGKPGRAKSRKKLIDDLYKFFEKWCVDYRAAIVRESHGQFTGFDNRDLFEMIEEICNATDPDYEDEDED